MKITADELRRLAALPPEALRETLIFLADREAQAEEKRGDLINSSTAAGRIRKSMLGLERTPVARINPSNHASLKVAVF